MAVYLIDGTTKLEESVYNAAGERVAMVAYQGGAATGFTKYLREGAAVVYEKSFTLSGGAHSNLSEKTYLYASGGMAVTKARNLQSNIATYSYYGIDHLGTARFSRTLDANGAVLPNGDAAYAFEPFGVTIPGPNPAPDPSGNTHLYTGQERDALPDGTSIDYMHFRFFSASMGRFQKPDNVMGSMGNPQTLNLYTYVVGNPVKFTDPTGHVVNLGNDWEKAKAAYDLARKAAGGGSVYLHIAGDSKSGYTLVTSNAQELAESGTVGHALSEWIGNKDQTLSIKMGPSAQPRQGGGGKTYTAPHGDATIYFDKTELARSNVNIFQPLGFVESPRTAFIHELGHSMFALHPELSDMDFGTVLGGRSLIRDVSQEPYAIAFENANRFPGDQRTDYVAKGDYTPANPMPDLWPKDVMDQWLNY